MDSLDLETSIQVLQCEYDDPLSTPRQKKPVSRTVGPRSRPGTHCPPLKNSELLNTEVVPAPRPVLVNVPALDQLTLESAVQSNLKDIETGHSQQFNIPEEMVT
ncbi:hypothetical protein J6590_048082 [Homalodisca vitripennis]|nr:hypothetical protein J6590_048082 [Homalodisca vitripennis]